MERRRRCHHGGRAEVLRVAAVVASGAHAAGDRGAAVMVTASLWVGPRRVGDPVEVEALALTQLPQWLAGWHARLAVGTTITCTLRVTAEDRSSPIDDVAARHRFVHDLFDGAGFTDLAPRHRAGALTVRAVRGFTLADRVGAGMRLLVCGLNPSRHAAEAGIAFARPGNRFWPALLGAGLAERDRDPDAAWRDHGIGFTDLVKRATRAADEVDPEEFRLGAGRVERLVRWLQPGVVCFFGVTGYRAGIDRRARAGVLPDGFGGRPAVLLGNPSGLNAHCRLDELIVALRQAVRLPPDAPYGPV